MNLSSQPEVFFIFSCINTMFKSPLMISSFQRVFHKNFELLKVKFKIYASSFILEADINELIPIFDEFMIEAIFSIEKKDEYPALIFFIKPIINTFLYKLTNYEIQSGLSHHVFDDDEWKEFGDIVGLKPDEAFRISECLFQNNFKNYKWSIEEDLLLRKTIIELNPEQTQKNRWKIISTRFNLESNGVQFRKPAQCKERWENILKKNFKKGNWSKNEDLKILQFVLNNGTKWAKLSREMENRTEHCVKNRFFGILAKYCLIPIKKIKSTVDYLNHNFLFDAIKYYQSLYGINNHEEHADEVNWNDFFRNYEDIISE